MAGISAFNSPFLLGFEDIERVLDRVTKTAADGYPPYNIEREIRPAGEADILRITLAVAGFSTKELEITLQENQLSIRGRQSEGEGRDYLHRGIAARQFQRSFVLANGVEIIGAELKNGLLSINMAREDQKKTAQTIEIVNSA